MSWLVLTFSAVLFGAVYGVMTKVLSDKLSVSSYTQAVLLPLTAALLSLLTIPIVGLPSFSGEVDMGFVLVAVASQGVGNILYFAGIKRLTSGTTQIAFSSILVFNTLLSVMLLGLELSFVNYIGVIVLLAAILSVVNGKIAFDKKGVSLIVASAFMFAVFQLSSAELSRQMNVSAYLLSIYFGAALIVFLFKAKLVAKDVRTTLNPQTVKVLLLVGVPTIATFISSYYAYRAADEPAKVAMLQTSQVVFAVLLGYVFLREREGILRKVLAALLVFLAAYLIKGS